MTKNERLENQANKIKNLIRQGRRPEAFTKLDKLVEFAKTKPRRKREARQ